MAKKLTVLLMAVIFVAGIVLMAGQAVNYRVSEQYSEDARELALPEQWEIPLAQSPVLPQQEEQEPLPEEAAFLTEVNLTALRYVNPDTLGWIYIPGTPVSYPLMAADSRDEYLHTAWDGTGSYAGSIYLEYKNDRSFTDFNTILYGHRMADNSMFGSLADYGKQEYRDAHPCVYIVTDTQILRYEVFSAYEASVESDTYRLYFADDAARETALTMYQERSVLQTDLLPQAQDRILTLSTCTGMNNYSLRWVVQAVLTGQWSR